MTTYPMVYEKSDFIKFLQKININEKTINKFKELPEKVSKNGSIYKLNIISTYNSEGNTSHSFELNYYSEDLIEFLFSYKIFDDVETSINNTLRELVGGNYIKKTTL